MDRAPATGHVRRAGHLAMHPIVDASDRRSSRCNEELTVYGEISLSPPASIITGMQQRTIRRRQWRFRRVAGAGRDKMARPAGTATATPTGRLAGMPAGKIDRLQLV